MYNLTGVKKVPAFIPKPAKTCQNNTPCSYSQDSHPSQAICKEKPEFLILLA